jgi:hypothetical protein
VPSVAECRSGPRLRRRWTVHGAALLLCLMAINTAVMLTGAQANAHPLSTTAVLLDVGPDQVTGQVQLPIDRLGIALNQPALTTSAAAQPAKREELRQYMANHVSAADSTGGATWTVSVTGGHVETIDNTDHLVFDLTLLPPNGVVHDFGLRYDAIVHRLLSHRIFVSSRPAGTGTYTGVGILDWETHTLTVSARSAPAEQGFLPAVQLGVNHIAEGADHLLFLVMLLLPAPQLVRRGRWVPGGTLRRQCFRILHVVTAFAVGHSITLALAALGYLSVPTRVVESLIALSIVVSGVHALRPIVHGGEIWIAAGFGLMHGLAFAALLGPLNLSRGSLVTELLGFNLGIELTQLIVVALIMPSLIVLSRTKLYPAARTALAGSGIVLAAAWLAERTTLVTPNPLEGISESLVARPFIVAGALACLAAAAYAFPTLRLHSPAHPAPVP